MRFVPTMFGFVICPLLVKPSVVIFKVFLGPFVEFVEGLWRKGMSELFSNAFLTSRAKMTNVFFSPGIVGWDNDLLEVFLQVIW